MLKRNARDEAGSAEGNEPSAPESTKSASPWLAFWNNPHTLYVNARHENACSLGTARNIAAFVPFSDARVLDYGCGAALHADLVAAAAGELWLCEAAPRVRHALAARFAECKNPKIYVIGPNEMECLPAHSFDLIVLNGVMQYLAPGDTDALFVLFHGLLSSTGTLIVGDVVPRDVGGLTDIADLLRLAVANGFLFSAVLGLTRTFVSDYRRVRAQVGLTRYSEADIMAKLREARFIAHRAQQNTVEHHRRRMTFIAQPT